MNGMVTGSKDGDGWRYTRNTVNLCSMWKHAGELGWRCRVSVEKYRIRHCTMGCTPNSVVSNRHRNGTSWKAVVNIRTCEPGKERIRDSPVCSQEQYRSTHWLGMPSKREIPRSFAQVSEQRNTQVPTLFLPSKFSTLRQRALRRGALSWRISNHVQILQFAHIRFRADPAPR